MKKIFPILSLLVGASYMSFGATSISGEYSGSTFAISEDSIIESGNTLSIKTNSSTNTITVAKNATLIVSDGAKLVASGKGVYVTGTLEIQKGADVKISKQIVAWGSSQIILNDVVTGTTGDPTTLLFAGGNAKATFGVSQTFKDWDVRFNNYTFTFAEGVDIAFNSVSFGAVEVNTETLVSTKKITLANFDDSNSIFIGVGDTLTYATPYAYEVIDDNTLSISGKCSGLDYGTALYAFNTDDGQDLKISEVYDNGALTGFMLTTASAVVPEPAEWAMIFGGIALAVAVYRRRK